MRYKIDRKYQKEILLHLGMSKALSTFLQKEIFPKMQNVNYNREEQHFLNKLSREIRYNSTLSFKLSISPNEINKIRKKISQAPKKKILISDENFDGVECYNYINRKMCWDSLYKIFPNAKVLYIIRRQDKYLESLYRQYISFGYYISLEEFINYKNGKFNKHHWRKTVNLDITQLNYYLCVKYLYKLFGEDNVLVLPYEAFKKSNKKFISKICKHYGVPDVSFKNIRRNRSLTSLSIKILRFFNRFLIRPYNPMGFIPEGPFIFKSNERKLKKSGILKYIIYFDEHFTIKKILRSFDNMVVRRISNNPDYKLMPNSIKEKILDYHKEPNKKLSKLINVDLEKYNYY